MSRADLKAKAKEQIKGKIGILFLIMIIVGAILATVGVIPLIGYATIVIQGPFTFALSVIYLNLTKKQEPEVADVFFGFKSNNFGRTFVASLLVSIFTFLWSLLLVIPGIIKSLAYSMTYFIMADNPEMSAQDAIKASQNLMKGHKGELFVLQLSFIGWYLLVGITFGLILIYLGPYMQATTANFYNNLKQQKVNTVIA